MKNERYILVDGLYGNNIVSRFIHNYDSEKWHISDLVNQWKLFEDSEEEQGYIEDEIIEKAYCIENGVKYTLSFDENYGDLVAIPYGYYDTETE